MRLPCCFQQGDGSCRCQKYTAGKHTMIDTHSCSIGPQRDCRRDGPIRLKLPQVQPKRQDEEVAGTLIPADVDLASSCSKVLLHSCVGTTPLQPAKVWLELSQSLDQSSPCSSILHRRLMRKVTQQVLNGCQLICELGAALLHSCRVRAKMQPC